MEYLDGNTSIQDKIHTRMKTLEMQMDNNIHLSAPYSVITTVYSITKFWNVLSEEDRDYVQCAQHAIESKSKWGEYIAMPE